MGRLIALAIGLVVLSVGSAGAARDPTAPALKALATVRDGASCMKIKDESACLTDSCSWCTGSLVGEACLANEVAKLLPTSVATCKSADDPDPDMSVSKGEKKAAVSCGDNDNKDDCLDLGAQEGDCAWCKGDFMPPSCVAVKAAEWIPSTVATCKMPKKKHDQPANMAAAPSDPSKKKAAVSCGDNKEKHDCLDLGAQEGDCAWCKGDFMPASCVSVKAAEWIPGTVASCKMPKKKDAVKADADVDKKKKKAAVSCGDNKEKDDCLDVGAEEGDCAWCKGDFMPPSCVSVKAAEWIPGTVASCKMPKKKHAVKAEPSADKKKKAAVSCGDNKEKDDCLDLGAQEGDCAWCKGDFMPASCVSVKAAEWIPGTVASCKMPKKHKEVAAAGPQPGPQPGPGMGCTGAKTKHDCMKAKDFMGGGCAWCDSQWQGKSCMGEQQAKYLPGAKCKFPKKDEVEVADAAVATIMGVTVDGKHHGKGGGDMPFVPGGGDMPYVPGGIPYGPGGGKGAGPQPGPGMGCMGAKTRKECLKAKDSYMGGGCAWCESQWQGKSCMSESQAKFQPMAKCQFPRHKLESS